MYYNELVKELNSKKLRNAYVLYGEDEGFMKEIIEDIKKLAGIPPDDIFNFIRIDGQKAGFAEIENSIYTLPFLGDRKIVEIFRADFFSGQQQYENVNEKIKLIAEFLANPPRETILIIYYVTDQEKKDTRIKALDNKADKGKTVVMKMPQVKKENIDDFIADYFKEHGKPISKPIQAYIKETFEGSILQLEKNLDKLYSYTEGRGIDKEDINKLVIKSGTKHKYDLLDMIIAGKARDALELYNELIYRRTDPGELLESIGGRLREVYNYKIRLSGGMGQEQLMKELNEKFPWLVTKKSDTYRNIPMERIKKMFDFLVDTEERFKGTGTDPEREIEMLILALCGTARA